jgi:NAD(P)-dependent dehydrogenase (short-subunit alcohol dehydrogenase family)
LSSTTDPRGLEGRVALITGAARDGGIGRATARLFAAAGMRLVIADIGRPLELSPDYGVATASELDQARVELEGLGAEVVAVHCDVTKDDEVRAMVAAAEESFGGLDVLVNNAGVSTQNVPVEELSESAFDQTVGVNLKGPFLCIRAATPLLRKSDAGRIVTVASQAGKTGWPLLGAYCASKFGVIGLTQVVAKELGPAGITVNAVCPGTLDNPLNDLPGGLWDAYGKLTGTTRDEIRASTLAQIPLARFQTPEDVGDLIAFLASDQGGYITGQALNTTGGQEMH